MEVHFKDGSLVDFPTTDHVAPNSTNPFFTDLLTNSNVSVVTVPTENIQYIVY